MAVVAAFFGGIEWDRHHAEDDRQWLRNNLRRLVEEYDKMLDTLDRCRVVLDRHDIDPTEIETVDLHQ